MVVANQKNDFEETLLLTYNSGFSYTDFALQLLTPVVIGARGALIDSSCSPQGSLPVRTFRLL